MGQTTNKLLIILVVLCSSFFCHHVTGLDNISTVSTRHEDGRRVLAGYASLFRVASSHEDGRRMLAGLASDLIRGARTWFKKAFPHVFQKPKSALKKADPVDIAQQATEFYLENGQTKNFTKDEAIDYLNCQCECPFFQLVGKCTCTAPQQLYCSKFQYNPFPLKCLNCSFIPPPTAPPTLPPTAPRTAPSVTSSASPLSDFVDALLMMVSTTISIIILVMNFS